MFRYGRKDISKPQQHEVSHTKEHLSGVSWEEQVITFHTVYKKKWGTIFSSFQSYVTYVCTVVNSQNIQWYVVYAIDFPLDTELYI